MYISIENEFLRLTVDTVGAQMRSIKSKNGCQYLWQGDKTYWSDRAPVLFPFIGRLEGRRYQLNGNEYVMGIHGFAASQNFTPESHTADTMVLSLPSTLATRVIYPYEFVLEITYRLVGPTIEIRNRVTNRSGKPMHFALGGHPGFQVPLAEGESFEDYFLEFSHPCQPERIGFTDDTILLNGQDTPYLLREDRILPLHHGLFDDDAVILRHTARQVTLKSHSGRRSVTVAYPDMDYLGIWHQPHTDAPYACIEPWTSLPGRSGVTEEISLRPDFIHLAPNSTYENTWTITIA